MSDALQGLKVLLLGTAVMWLNETGCVEVAAQLVG